MARSGERTKILYVHLAIAHYEVDFFEGFSELFQTKFLLTNAGIAKRIYKNESSLSKPLNVVNIHFPKWINLMKHILKEDYDILMVSALDDPLKIIRFLPSFLIAKFKRRPVVFDPQFWEPDYTTAKVPVFKQLRRWWVQKLRLFVIHKVDVLIPYAGYPYQYLKQVGIPKEKIKSQTVFISSMKEEPSLVDVREAYGIPKEDVLLLYFGRIVPRKGLDKLIEAFLNTGISSQSSLLIVGGGQGSFFDHCKQLADKSSKIIFANHVDATERYTHFKASDIFILPCYPFEGATEPWGLSVNEALQAETAVITTNNSGVSAAVLTNNENAIVIDQENVDKELCESLVELVNDKELREKLAKNGRKLFEQELRKTNRLSAYQKALSEIIE